MAEDGSGSTIIMVPADYMSWNETLQGYVSRDEHRDKDIRLFIAGVLSEAAEKNINDLGWQVQQKSQFYDQAF